MPEQPIASTTTPDRQTPDDLDDDEELLTVHEAAAWLKVPASWIYDHTRHSATDRLPALRLGKYVRFRRADLRAYIKAKAPTVSIVRCIDDVPSPRYRERR